MYYCIAGLCHRDDVDMGWHGFIIHLHPRMKELVAASGIDQGNANTAIETMGRGWLDASGYGCLSDGRPLYNPRDVRVKWGEYGAEHITVPGNACGLDIGRACGNPLRGQSLLPHNVDSLQQKYLLLIVFSVWHRDPERGGDDDSCGWFPRARRGDRKVLDAIAAVFLHEFTSGVPEPWFDEYGKQNYSTHAIAVGMFRIAANEAFGRWSGRAERFLRRHAYDILHFAENSCDSLCTFIEQSYGADTRSDKERAEFAAAVVYGWILRKDRPWWRHPRWHFWHWEVVAHPLEDVRRYLLSRCCKCGRGFAWKAPVVGVCWDSPPRRRFELFRPERYIAHFDCSHPDRGPVFASAKDNPAAEVGHEAAGDDPG